MRSFLKRYFSVISLVVVAVGIFVLNVKPNTYLIGWDHLSTELNPALAIKRAFFAVWQEYQSLGLVGGMAHASDLVRAVLTGILSLFVPQSLIRYLIHTALLAVGAIGALKLLRLKQPVNEKASLAGALFYMLNLGTLQIFYVPFEPFSWFFAALPWELWIFQKALNEKLTKKNLLLFMLINFLATPQAYLQTLFLVYGLTLFCFSLAYMVKNRSVESLKKIGILLTVVFMVNAFWLFPQLYFVKANGSVVQQAKINQLATEDVFYQNLEKGTVPDFITLKGFYFDLYRSNKQQLFLEWHDHYKQVPFMIVSYLLSAVVLLGLFTGGLRNKNYLFVYGVCAVALLSATPIFRELGGFFRSNPLINQVFRSPFTKFIVLYSLVSSFFFAQGIDFLGKKLSRQGRNIAPYIVIGLIFLYSLPTFRGYFFSPSMKIRVPSEYLEAVDYFKGQDKNKRIALLPDYTFWGWFYHSWGYNGSGFLWYGIEQPILARAFDVWSAPSERYFWELKAAVEAEDRVALVNTLQKYNVEYVLLDKSYLPISSISRSLQYENLEDLLRRSPELVRVRTGKYLDIYQVTLPHKTQDFISHASHLPSVGPEVNAEYGDTVYEQTHGYLTDANPQLHYPFRNLMSQTRANRKWKLTETEKEFVLKAPLDVDMNQYRTSTSSAGIYEMLLNSPGGVKTYHVGYQIELGKDTISARVPKVLVSQFDPSKTKVTNCEQSEGKINKQSTPDGFQVEARDGAIACFGYGDPYLEQRYGYLVTVQSKTVEGRNLFFYIIDSTKKQSYLEDRLQLDKEYFFLSPKFQYGVGYGFTFQSNSYKNFPSVNQVNGLEIYAFPYEVLKNLALLKKGDEVRQAQFFNDFTAEKKNYGNYTVSPAQKNGVIILNQAFDNGWKAYQNGKELKDHVLINNWANGWVLDGSTEKISILFWPQYLEYLGFGLLAGTLLFILLKRDKS